MKRFFKLLKYYFLRIWYHRQPEVLARKLGVRVGKGTKFISLPNIGSEPYLISIGEKTYFSYGVKLITHDGGRWVLDNLYPNERPFYKFGRIVVGDNCFIGAETMIMPNVTISNNCVIGGGSLVTKDVPEGQVWAGVPAKFICTIEEYHDRMKSHEMDINWKAYWRDKESELKRVFSI